MNIDDVEAPVERPLDLQAAIFAKQRELMEKYHHIEHSNGLLQTEEVPVDLHCRYGQARLKDFAWRMTEEFTEATEAGEDRSHYLEELVDGLHFLVELMILADFYPGASLEHWFEEQAVRPVSVYQVIERVGCAMNCLKNKPWKQTHMLTDTAKFRAHLGGAWFEYCGLMVAEGLTPGDLYDLYFRKSTVNSFRQRSKY